MVTIKTNEEKRKEKVEAEIKRVIQICEKKATDGKTYAYVHLPKDVQRDVRDILDSTTNIFVAIDYGSTPSRYCVDYYDKDTVEVKFTWS